MSEFAHGREGHHPGSAGGLSGCGNGRRTVVAARDTGQRSAGRQRGWRSRRRGSSCHRRRRRSGRRWRRARGTGGRASALSVNRGALRVSVRVRAARSRRRQPRQAHGARSGSCRGPGAGSATVTRLGAPVGWPRGKRRRRQVAGPILADEHAPVPTPPPRSGRRATGTSAATSTRTGAGRAAAVHARVWQATVVAPRPAIGQGLAGLAARLAARLGQ